MRPRGQVEERAHAIGARPETVEKVLLLLEILERLRDHELTSGRWVLKGGTALNVFHLDLPRLSVDVDLNFVGCLDIEELGSRRASFEAGLRACCERAGCRVRRISPAHAGGKVSLHFDSGFGGSQGLEVDVNYVLRSSLLGIEDRGPTGPLAPESGPVPLLALNEIAAGKLCALLMRREREPRDFYDAIGLLDLDAGLVHHPDLRLAFAVLAGAQRQDVRRLEGLPELPTDLVIRRRLDPMLRRVEGREPPDAVRILREGEAQIREAIGELLEWAPNERRFLDRLHDDGELEPELITNDPDRRERIRTLPMLRWKAFHVRKHLGLEKGD